MRLLQAGRAGGRAGVAGERVGLTRSASSRALFLGTAACVCGGASSGTCRRGRGARWESGARTERRRAGGEWRRPGWAGGAGRIQLVLGGAGECLHRGRRRGAGAATAPAQQHGRVHHRQERDDDQRDYDAVQRAHPHQPQRRQRRRGAARRHRGLVRRGCARPPPGRCARPRRRCVVVGPRLGGPGAGGRSSPTDL